MADDRFPFGKEINDVGSETNESYYSEVTSNGGSYKKSSNETGSETNVSQIESVSSTSEIVSETITASETTTAASTASTTATVTTASVATVGTVAAVTIGVITGAAIVQTIFGRNFSYSSSMEDRAIYYSLEVEYEKDALVYVHLLDEQNNEVGINEFEIVTEENKDHVDKNIYEISGEFYDLHYHQNYNLEAYYFDGEERFVIYEQKDLTIEFIDYDLYNVNFTFDSPNQRLKMTFDYDYTELNKQIDIQFFDMEEEVIYSETMITSIDKDNPDFIDYGESYYHSSKVVEVEGVLADNSYRVSITLGERQLYQNSFSMPGITQCVFVDEFTYESDMISRQMYYHFDVNVSQDEIVYLSLFDESNQLVEQKEYQITLEDCELVDDKYYASIDDVFNNLHYKEIYHVSIYYIDGISEISIFEMEDIKIDYQPYSVNGFAYTPDSRNLKANISFYYTFDLTDMMYEIEVKDINDVIAYNHIFVPEVDSENPGYIDYGEGYYRMLYEGEITDLSPSNTYQINIYSVTSNETINQYAGQITMPGVDQQVFINANDFTYSSEMKSRSISYSGRVNINQNETLYVALYDDNNEVIETKSHEIDMQETYIEEDLNYFNIEGTYSNLSYSGSYQLEIYYYEGLIKTTLLSKAGLKIDYIPNELTNLYISPDSPYLKASISFDMTFDKENTKIHIEASDNQSTIVYSEDIYTSLATSDKQTNLIDYGEGFYQATFMSDITNLNYSESYHLIISIVDEDKTNVLMEESFTMPDIAQNAHVIEDSFTYESDMYLRTYYYYLSIVSEISRPIYIALYDDKDVLVSTNTHDVTSSGEDEPVDIEGSFTLSYKKNYRIVVYYLEGLVEMNIYSINNITLDYEVFVTSNVITSADAPNKSATISFDMTFDEENKEINVYFKDGEDIKYNETILTSFSDSQPGFIDYGEGLYQATFTSNATGLDINKTYQVLVTLTDSTSGEETVLIDTSVTLPDVPQQVNIAEFSTSSSMTEHSIDAIAFVESEIETTVYVSIYDSDEQLLDTHEHEIGVTTELSDGGIEINDTFTDLDYQSNYTVRYSYNNQLVGFTIFEQEVSIDYVPNEVTSTSFNYDASTRSFRFTSDVTFDEEGTNFEIIFSDLAGATLASETFTSVIDSDNPGYHDYGGGLYGMRHVTSIMSGFTTGQEYQVIIKVGNNTIYEEDFTMPESEDGYKPFVTLSNYESNYETESVLLVYTFIENGITYDSYVIQITNLYDSTTTEVEVSVQVVDEQVSIYLTMGEYGLGSGFTYRIQLCGVDGQSSHIILAQNAIYY